MSSGPKKKQSEKQSGGPRARSSDKPRESRSAAGKSRSTRAERPRFAREDADKPRAMRSGDKPRFAKPRDGADKPRFAKPRDGADKPRFAKPRDGADKPRFAKPRDGADKPRFAKPRDGADKPRFAKPRDGADKPRFAKPRDGADKPRFSKPRAGEDNGRLSRANADKPRAGRPGDKPRAAGKGEKLRGKRAEFTPRSQRGAGKTRGVRAERRAEVNDAALPFQKSEKRKAAFNKKAAESESRTAEPRYQPPKQPIVLSKVSVEPHPGQWLFTTREGSEQDLIDELQFAKVVDPAPRVLGPALVLSPKLPKREGAPMELTFARQGFEIVQSVKSHDIEEVISRVARSLRHQLDGVTQYALHVWVPDSTVGNPLSSLADTIDERVAAELARTLPDAHRIDDATLRRNTQVKLAQVCVLDGQRVVAGVMYANRTPSVAKGGRTRVRVTGNFPSRAARKVEEALAWLGVAPGPGETCVDLGAAPGGWTYVLAERRARVIAVDPAKLRPDIAAKKGVRHVQDSAFTFTPDEHVDWLFCDMAWRPLEAAALLAKWGRRRWARIMVANIKLPMSKKVEILARIRHILEEEGEWKHVRIKQLYHDREEITLTALKA